MRLQGQLRAGTPGTQQAGKVLPIHIAVGIEIRRTAGAWAPAREQ